MLTLVEVLTRPRRWTVRAVLLYLACQVAISTTVVVFLPPHLYLILAP